MNGNSLIKKLFEKFYFNFYLFLLIFTPLLFVTNTGELFEFPKTFFIYYAALLCLMVYVIDMISNKTWISRPSLTVLFYVAVFILTTITSMHFYTSLWGYYTRFNDGLMSVLAFFALYYVAKNKLTSTDISRLSNAILLPIIPVALYGIAQHFGLFEGRVVFGEKSDRVYSTFGQPNWLAQYLVMLLPVVLYKTFYAIKPWFWYTILILGYTCLWFTFSMSGFAGFGASFAIGLFYLFRQLGFKRVRVKIGFLLIYILMLAVLFPGILEKRLYDIRQDLFGMSVSPVYASSENLNANPSKYKLSDAGFIRKYAWVGTWNLIKSSSKNFILGTGPETYPYSFQPFRPVELNYSSEWSYLFNKPHNYYLEIWAESGLLGLVAYGILFFKVSKNQTIDKRLGLVGFAITNIFGWPVVATTLVFWFWLIEVEEEQNA
ncbi:hypothetical protein GYA27_03910 [candidate division WWE3 bacterium]|uniref:O-antigen ligase-related domain-containing protein n=1 Tax=candidate division WWE3 bacterium TaxID=2053526 RepID=A0A7X9DLB7_UNCKA|nr:hypothetical protein [candidate division WWE3 bacterium]